MSKKNMGMGTKKSGIVDRIGGGGRSLRPLPVGFVGGVGGGG